MHKLTNDKATHGGYDNSRDECREPGRFVKAVKEMLAVEKVLETENYAEFNNDSVEEVEEVIETESEVGKRAQISLKLIFLVPFTNLELVKISGT